MRELDPLHFDKKIDPHVKATIDARVKVVAEAALRALPKVTMFATANSFDRFLYVAAGVVEDAIVGEIDILKDDQCAWFENYLNEPKPTIEKGYVRLVYGGRLEHPDRRVTRQPRLNPLNVEICRKVYDSLAKTHE